MKITELKKVIKETVKEAIQEELKDILLEAIKSPKSNMVTETPTVNNTLPSKSKEEIRENYMKVLDGMRPGANGTITANTNSIPLQVNGPMDTTSPNGSLPQGEVSMDQIMGLMNK
jgi:hypothetical protein